MSFRVCKKVDLQKHHLRPGRTVHSYSSGDGMRDFPPFVCLKVAQYPGDTGFYLLHISEKGMMADTYHETMEEALHQAEYEFEVKPGEWTDVIEQL